MSTLQLAAKDIDNIRDLLRNGEKVKAVLMVQKISQAGLKTSKEYVDKIAEEENDCRN